MPVDIQKLASEVLSHVDAAVKTASAVETPAVSLNTEVGQQLLKLAETLKDLDDSVPTNQDLQALRNIKKTAATVDQTPAISEYPDNASQRGNLFRKLAHNLRVQGQLNEEVRATKTAKIVNAAVGLQHLGGK